jgi:hypothetical protein
VAPFTRVVAAIAGFTALAVWWTWPVAAALSSRIAHDPGDPILNTWILWWNTQAIPFTERWWNAPIMWPMPGAVALSEHLVGSSLITTPLQWAGASPIAAYNICLIASYALSAFFAYLLAYRLTGSRVAGVIAGLAFGYSPYRASQLAHIQVLSAQWMPLALLGLHAYVETGASRWLLLFGIAWLIQALSNGYYLLFFPILIVAWVIWFVEWQTAPRRGLAILTMWVIASLPLVPVLLTYRHVHERLGLVRDVSDTRNFSAVPMSFVQAAPLMRLWPAGAASNDELHLFTGVTVIALVVVGIALMINRRSRDLMSLTTRRALLFYLVMAVVMAILALGPGDRGDGSALVYRPYTWLLHLPGYSSLRVPARFWMLGTLCLSIAASLSVATLSTMLTTKRARAIAGAILIAALIGDGVTRSIPVAAAPARVNLPEISNAAVVELPLDNTHVSIDAMYRAMSHHHPLINGYSGHVPLHYAALSLALARGDASPLLFLARGRPLIVVVHDSSYRAMVEALPGVQRQGISSGGDIYVVPAQAEPPQTRTSTPLPADVHPLDDRRLAIDLRHSTPVSAIVISLKRRPTDLAERVLVEASDDGVTWREAWRGWTGGLVLEATLADPRVTAVEIPLAGVSARYLRVYPAASWMAAGLVVR